MGYNLPIMAVLCDGKQFYFYKFVQESPADGSPQLFLGKFPNGEQGISVGNMMQCIEGRVFYRTLRRICDALYYVFLTGYVSGLEAYWNRSVERGKAQGSERNSTPKWFGAKLRAKRALQEAVLAWKLHDEGKLEESIKSAERAAEFLARRYLPFCPLVIVNSNNNVVSEKRLTE